jgi:ABC-type uncharacterized transport system YnjBCD substrate-binding protein
MFARPRVWASAVDIAEIAKKLQAERRLLVYWPAGANFKRWLADRLVAGFRKHMQDIYGVDVEVNLLATGGGDAAFWQKFEAFRQGGGPSFPIDVVRVAPDLRTLSAISSGRFLPLLPENAALLPNLGTLNEDGRATFTHSGALYAAPMYQPTIALFYNSQKIPAAPASLEDLAAWAKANPGGLTYEDPRSASGIGSGVMFLLAVMHKFGKVDDPATWEAGWSYLKGLQPYLHPQPNTGEQAIELMRRGEIAVMPFWNDWGLVARQTLGLDSLRNGLIASGAPLRSTPIAIPAKAEHPTAALLFLEWATSPEIQASLGQDQHQIPASMAPETWTGMPADAFGFTYEEIRAHSFPAFDCQRSVEAIAVLAQEWSRNVLGR